MLCGKDRAVAEICNILTSIEPNQKIFFLNDQVFNGPFLEKIKKMKVVGIALLGFAKVIFYVFLVFLLFTFWSRGFSLFNFLKQL